MSKILLNSAPLAHAPGMAGDLALQASNILNYTHLVTSYKLQAMVQPQSGGWINGVASLPAMSGEGSHVGVLARCLAVL